MDYSHIHTYWLTTLLGISHMLVEDCQFTHFRWFQGGLRFHTSKFFWALTHMFGTSQVIFCGFAANGNTFNHGSDL